MKIKRKGQTTIEYVLIVVIVGTALLTTQIYIKRAVQGRWKTSVDDLGDQYDPKAANTKIRHSISQDTETALRAEIGAEGVTTYRSDKTLTTDYKNGTMGTGRY